MAATVDSPLERVQAVRHNGFGLGVVAGPVDEPGWRDAHDVGALPALMDVTAASLGPAPRGVAAAWHVENHAWQVCSLVVAALLLDGALPDLGTVQLHDGEQGWADQLAVAPDGWRIRASASEAAQALDAHLEPVIAELSARRAARALWREAGDRLGQAVLWCGEALGRREEAWALGTLMLETPTRLKAHAGFELRDGLPFRLRGGCCLSYRCEDGVKCPDCPLKPGS